MQVYWLVDLNDNGDRFPFFFINLFVSLMVVESLMMSIAAIVPHYVSLSLACCMCSMLSYLGACWY